MAMTEEERKRFEEKAIKEVREKEATFGKVQLDCPCSDKFMVGQRLVVTTIDYKDNWIILENYEESKWK